MSKIRGRICYTCRLKGHLSQDCPNSKRNEPKVANSASNVHGNSNGLYDTRKVISSLSARAIWVQNFYWLTSKDPMRLWYQNMPKKLQVAWNALRAWLLYNAIINFESVKLEGILDILIPWHHKARWVLNHDPAPNVYLNLVFLAISHVICIVINSPYYPWCF
jgi:hypothetical protein